MANFERTKQLMDKLKSGGSEITDADLLMSFIKLSTDLGNIWTTAKKDKLDVNLDLALKGLSSSAKALDYTDYDKEAPTGSEGDLYDYNRTSFVTALENLEDTLKTPYIEDKYGDAIDLAIRSNQAALAFQDTMRGQRATNINEMTTLMEEYTAMAQSDPLLTDPGDYEHAKDIMQHLTDLRTHIEKQTGKDMISEHLVPLQKAQKEFQIISDLHQMDRDKNMEGIQANIQDEYSPYLKKWMEERGIIATEGEEGLATLGLPEDNPDTPYIDESRIFVGVDAVDYTEARNAFNDYQDKIIALDAQNIYLEQVAEETKPFTIMRDWMEAPGSAEQASAGNVISYQLFSDTKYTFEENISGRGDLKDISIAPGAYRDMIKAKYNELYVLQKEGKNPQQFANMQTTYNRMQGIQERITGKTIDQLDEESAKNVRFAADELNNQLTVYNARFKGKKDHPDLITEVPNFSEKTLRATTAQAKRKTADVMDKVLARANRWESEGSEPGGEIKLIRNYEDATGEARWPQMQALVDDYLTPGGSIDETKKEEINAAFDADWMGGRDEKNDVNTFYTILISFYHLAKADPTGTDPYGLLKSLIPGLVPTSEEE